MNPRSLDPHSEIASFHVGRKSIVLRGAGFFVWVVTVASVARFELWNHISDLAVVVALAVAITGAATAVNLWVPVTVCLHHSDLSVVRMNREKARVPLHLVHRVGVDRDGYLTVTDRHGKPLIDRAPLANIDREQLAALQQAIEHRGKGS